MRVGRDVIDRLSVPPWMPFEIAQIFKAGAIDAWRVAAFNNPKLFQPTAFGDPFQEAYLLGFAALKREVNGLIDRSLQEANREKADRLEALFHECREIFHCIKPGREPNIIMAFNRLIRIEKIFGRPFEE